MSSELGSIRAYVLEHLTPLVPDTWEISDKIPTLNRTLTKPVLWLEYNEFAPLDSTNPAALAVASQLEVCIVTNRTDMREAETDADDMVADLYHQLVASMQFYGMTARKAVFEQAYFGWRITTTIATTATPQEG